MEQHGVLHQVVSRQGTGLAGVSELQGGAACGACNIDAGTRNEFMPTYPTNLLTGQRSAPGSGDSETADLAIGTGHWEHCASISVNCCGLRLYRLLGQHHRASTSQIEHGTALLLLANSVR
jgi:hypothetical protein